MPIKFLEQKEKQETLIYLVVFLLTLTLLIHFRGVNFDFYEPDIIIENREDFLDIKKTLNVIESYKDINNSRPFNLIPPFIESLGRENPFIIEDSPIQTEIETIIEEDLINNEEDLINNEEDLIPIPQENQNGIPEEEEL